jgi:glycosyltransferase involved in cell wall biosynthesis
MGADAAALLADAPGRRAMGRRARESALARYNTDRVIPQYVEFYERILAASPR